MIKRDKEGKIILSKNKYANNPLLLEAYRQGYKEGYQIGRLSGWDWALNAIETEENRTMIISPETESSKGEK